MKKETVSLRCKSPNVSTKKSIKNCICGKSFSFLLLVILAAAIFVHPVAAAGTPTRMIVFTDKDVYRMGSNYDTTNGGTTTYPANSLSSINIKVYLAILDDDGNLIKNKTGLTLTTNLKDVERYDHAASTTSHSDTISTNGNFWNGSNSTFTDSDGDGIWETSFSLTDADTLGYATGTGRTDQFNISIRVNETVRGLTSSTFVLFTRIACGHAATNRDFTGTNRHGDRKAHLVACVNCHWGWEHKMGVHGNNTLLGNNVSTLPAITTVSALYNYNAGAETGTPSGNYKNTGRSDICVACHDSNTGSNSILDLDTTFTNVDKNGDGILDNNRPSCGWSQGTNANGVWTSRPGCHDNGVGNTTGTLIEKVPLKNATAYFTQFDWKWKQNGPGKSYGHNRTGKNVSCEVCHGNHEVKGFPNQSGSKTNINEQCWYCHNITGGLNITSNGGINVGHDGATNCKGCHYDGAGKLDSHLVPQGKSGGVNCTSCHNIGGSAGHDVDITNMGLGAHANLSNRSQYTGGNITNRKCWACHGTLNASGYANETDQPTGSHNETIYNKPRLCTVCHNNSNSKSNFSAPQVVEHRIGAPEVPTPGIQCSLCHNNSLTTITETDGFGITNAQNATASHYLKDANINLMTTTNHSNECRWCHITNNLSTAWGTPFDPRNGSVKKHSATEVDSDQDCYGCHGGLSATVRLHDSKITAGSSGGQDCISCHDGTTGTDVNVGNMNQSDSIHRTLNTGATSNGRVENKMCYACHTNNSYINASGVVNNGSLPVTGHPTGYDTPRNCTLCHINTNAGTNFSARQAVEHRSGGNEIQTKTYTNINNSCIACHIESEMLRSFSDNSGTNYSNVSHYGKSRNDTLLVSNNVVNCKYCHYNGTSTKFDFIFSVNRTISNHSLNYPTTTPRCTDCHREGRQHDSNLTIPVFNNALCTGCHTTRQAHNTTVQCINCHVNSTASRDRAHPIGYINFTGKFNTSNISSVDCQNCHQGAGIAAFSNAPKIGSPLNHSNDNAGQKWGNYWGGVNTSCDYCHGDTRHNAAALGKPSKFQGNNKVDQTDLTQSTWCLECHVYGSVNYNLMLGNLSPIPPQIKSGYPNYNTSGTDHAGFTINNDNDCVTCHKGNTTSITAYMHNLSIGTGCTGCHSQPPSGTVRYNMTGSHDLHAAEGYGNVPEVSCDYCHNGSGRNEPSHGTYNNASVITNSSASIVTYVKKLASGNDDTCSGVSCHSSGLSSTAARTGTATWNSSNLSCTNCHSTQTTGIPTTGNHSTKHYNTSKGYTCAMCHGTNADAGTQIGHKTNANIDLNFTGTLAIGGSINASKTCTVYCHSPNSYDVKAKPTWDVSSVACGDCHSNPPATTRTSTPHPASNGSDCYTCHGAGANTGTQIGHIDGTITTSGMTCETCHASYNAAVISTKHNQNINPGAPNCTLCHTGYEPVSGHTTGNKGYTVNESNTCRNCHIDNVNGFKEAHTSSSDCTQCHFANTTRPFSLNASLNTHDHNLTVEHSYYEYTNGGGMPLAINGGTGVGMFPQYTCSLTCHATRNPEKVDKASSTWLNSSHADSRFGTSDSKNNCALCKSPTNYDDNLKLTNPVIAEQDWDGIQCKVCHNLHNRSYSGISGNPVAFYNATASSYVNYSVYDKVSNNTDLCEKCHQPGGSHDSKFAGPHKTTSSFTCTSCHMNASFSRGMHDFQVKNTTSSVTGCEVCHNPVSHSFQFTSQHTDKVDCVACHDQTFTTVNSTGYAVSGDNYFGLWKETPTSVWTTAKKMSSSPGTWPLHNLSRSVNCDKCHGAQSVFNGTIALDSGAFCESCHTQPPSGTVRYNMTGAHDLHKTKGYGSVPETSCDYCHSTGGRNNPGHTTTNDNASVVTNASASIGTYVMIPVSGNDDTCSGVSCHSIGLTPAAQVGTAVWNTATAGSCTNCHSTVPSGMPPTGNHSKHYTTEGYSCAECHGTNADTATQTGHNNGTRDINFTNLSYGGSINSTKACSVYCHSPNPTYDPKPKPVWNITNVSCGDCHSIPPTPFTTRNGVSHTSDTNCDGCHGTGAITGEQSGHINGSIEASGSGCISCHSIDRNSYPAINLTLFTKHSNVNTTGGTGNLIDDDCMTCHYDFNMTLMYDPVNDTPTKACTDCHITGSYQAPIISNHRPSNISIIPGGAIGTKEYCSTCHINSINEFNFSVNASISHYGTTASLLKPTVNQTSMPGFGFMNPTDASTYNKECSNCHNPSNPDYGNATLITVSHTSKGTCNGCHVNASASDLHNSTLSMPETFGCKACHTTYAEKYGAPNLIGTTMAGKSITSCEGCHGGGGNNGLLDSLSKHNIDRNENGFTGIPGRTDTVYLNDQITLTVTKGTVVTVTSSVNDTAGQASRVGGAEYYIDTDPGIGKGTPMDAADGYYNAVNANWENITGTIDTSALSAGTHTIYVRGMDIGKQWSAVQSTTLTVLAAKGYINGTVTSAGSAIAGATVSTTGVSTITDTNGNYSLTLDSGTYGVTVILKPKYYDNTTTGIVVTTNNATIQNFVLTLKPTGTISGTVRNA